MMQFFSSYLGQKVVLRILGDSDHKGILVDYGTDIVVINNYKQYIYFPLHHIQHLMSDPEPDAYASASVTGFVRADAVSFEMIMKNAIGHFAEIYLAGHQSMHGKITEIQTDYFCFSTPLYRRMFIPLFHLKWISPSASGNTPFLFDDQTVVSPDAGTLSLSPAFAEQIKKWKGRLIGMDIGLPSQKIGQLHALDGPILELVSADEKTHHYHIQHIKNIAPLHM